MDQKSQPLETKELYSYPFQWTRCLLVGVYVNGSDCSPLGNHVKLLHAYIMLQRNLLAKLIDCEVVHCSWEIAVIEKTFTSHVQ